MNLRSPVSEAEAKTLSKPPPVPGEEPPPLRPRVLVVDDDERNLLAIGTVLEDVGEVVVANSGEEALRHLLRGEEFAVILLDVYMPDMDGYETAQIIRSREQTKGIPIVFLSAVNKETEHLIRGYAMGAVDYVFKPVDAIVLQSKVAVFVDLFAKTKEIERKARQEQALLDENLRANAELLRAEQELRRAEQRQAAIIQSLPILLYLEPLDCNPRCPTIVSGDVEGMTGFDVEAMADSSLWLERLHEDDRDRVGAAIAARGSTGRLSIEYRWRCADGSYKHFHDQAVLLKDSHGRPAEFAGTLTDVTERRSLEDQLIQAHKMDSIGKLTGGIAHDFNNLLAAVLGGLGLLERRANLEDEHRKILAMTKRAADQGSELVRRLLAFARRQQLQPAAVDVTALEGVMNDLLEHTLGGLVELEWRIADESWCVFADQPQLELALMNLIINARDAMADGGTIVISAGNRTTTIDEGIGLEPGDYVVLAVADSGSGILPENLDKVMEPFFTTKDVGKGTGLGLSMVYGFARQSDGGFRLHSELGRGTVAEIWLPRAQGTAAAGPAGDGEQLSPETQKPLSILLVDDHEDVRTATAAMLEELGHKVAEAANGPEALELLKDGQSEFDLLISDYAMPNLSGGELVRQARILRPGLGTLIITGYAEGDAAGAATQGVDVLFKPFSLDALTRAIGIAMSGRS